MKTIIFIDQGPALCTPEEIALHDARREAALNAAWCNSPETQASLAAAQEAFNRSPTSDVVFSRLSGVGEESPGLHLTAAEFEESWPRVVAVYEQLFTEAIQEGFDRWMAREGVS